jgi:hypothetical protein
MSKITRRVPKLNPEDAPPTKNVAETYLEKSVSLI